MNQPETWQLIAGLGGVNAVVGAFVAWLAYSGYRRNDSRPMVYLAVGIVSLTTGRFVVAHSTDQLLSGSESTVVLLVTVANLLGVTAIGYSLRTS